MNSYNERQALFEKIRGEIYANGTIPNTTVDRVHHLINAGFSEAEIRAALPGLAVSSVRPAAALPALTDDAANNYGWDAIVARESAWRRNLGGAGAPSLTGAPRPAGAGRSEPPAPADDAANNYGWDAISAREAAWRGAAGAS